MTLLMILVLGACKTDKAEPADPLPLEGLIAADTLLGFPNLDDDDQDGVRDWEDEARPEGEDDLVALPLPADVFVGVGGKESVVASLDGEGMRVWLDGALLLDDEAPTATLATTDTDGTLEVEWSEPNQRGSLTIEHLDSAGEVLRTVSVPLHATPLILNHHLQIGEEAMAMSATGVGGNEPFTDGFKDVLPGEFETFSLGQYGYDVWVQDEIEFGTMTTPERRMDLVIDSIRTDNGAWLDKLPEAEFLGPDFAVQTWGGTRATSRDSFGNLEVSPPVTVDGVKYPYGRIYWGEANGRGVTPDLTELLRSQEVQAPFTLDTSWLCVGHVDEFVSFLPDPDAPKGFRLYVSSPADGLALLDTLDPTLSLPRYAEDHNYATVGEMVDDEALRAINEEWQVDYIEPNVDTLKRELGLDDDDIVWLPALYEKVTGCNGAGLSLITGTINMAVYEQADGTTHLFMPDPFFRVDDDDPGSDPIIAAIEPLLPASAVPHWLDDWDYYHIMMGEVHCGSNTIREPEGEWWVDAAHLMGGEL